MHLLRHPLILFILRVGVAAVFLLFGITKAFEPFSAMIATVAQYAMTPTRALPIVAGAFLVAEIFVGVTLLLGLFTRRAIQLTLVLMFFYILAITQALIRGIAIADCGCSAAVIHLGTTPWEVLARDLAMVAALVWLLIVMKKQKYLPWSIDRYLAQK